MGNHHWITVFDFSALFSRWTHLYLIPVKDFVLLVSYANHMVNKPMLRLIE